MAEEQLADWRPRGTSLESLVMRVTERPDYTPVARQILETLLDSHAPSNSTPMVAAAARW